jgi:hypothetical protein
MKTSSQTINVVNVGLDALEAGFELYPNPTEGLVLIHIPNAIESAVIEVSDLSGRVLRSESIQNAAQPLQLNLTTLSAGTYVVTIREGSQVWTARVLKH